MLVEAAFQIDANHLSLLADQIEPNGNQPIR